MSLYVRYQPIALGGGGSGSGISIGSIDSQSPSPNGGTAAGSVLYFQSASSTAPGLVNTSAQIFTGTKTFDNIIDSGLTISTAVIADGSKQLASSITTSTELSYVHGVTSSIQTQLDGKQPTGVYIKADGSVLFTADQSMNSHKLTNVTDPVGAQDAATKAYVDAGLAALNPAQAVFAASTSSFAGTYVPVAAGIGDTFTTTSTATFTIDGTTPALLSRILFKDQSSGYQNGIYDFTALPVGGVSGAVFTRSLDYDTPSDMNNAGLIPVINGTVNALSSWQQIAAIVSIGPAGTALVFTEFTANPSLYVLKANNLSDVASKSASFNNLSPMTTLGDIIYGGASGTGTRLAGDTSNANRFLRSVSSASVAAAPTWAALVAGDIPSLPASIITSGTLAVNVGGTGVGSVSTVPAATAFAGWDGNKNLSANNLIDGYTTQATVNGTAALTVASAGVQAFTGSTSGQIVTLPTTSVTAGMTWTIVNTSTQVVTLNASGGGTIQAMASNTQVIATANAATPTTAAGWSWIYLSLNAGLLGGTVTSVTFTGDGTVFSSTPSSAVTTTGTLTAVIATSAKQTYLGGPTSGSAAAPTYRTFTPPTIQTFTSTGSTTGYLFTITGSNTCAVGDTYTNNTHTYTVLGALSAQSGAVLFTSSPGAPAASGNLARATGSGTNPIAFTSSVALGTYTAPTSPAPLYIKVRMVGGGGGGGSSGTAGGTTAAPGKSSYFGSNLIAAGGGAAGAFASRGGVGGTPNAVGAGAVQIIAAPGGNGSGLSSNVTLNATGLMGGPGGNSYFGGGGGGGPATTSTSTESNAAANTGGGGGGGGSGQQANNDTGSGGGAGAYIEAAVLSSVAATYPYAVGTAGVGGGIGTNGATGGSGADGLIIVEEYYQ